MSYLPAIVLVSLPLSTVVAQAPNTPKPHQITFDTDTITLQDALKAFQKQASATVTADETLGNPKITLKEKTLPFWQMVDQIARVVKAQPYPYAGDQTIHLRPVFRDAQVPTGYDGIFRTSLKQWSLTRNFESGSTDYTLTLEIAWQPGFVPLYLQGKLRNVIVKNGAEELKLAETGGSWTPVDNDLATSLRLSTPALKKNPLTLDLLQGELLIRGASEMTTLDFGPVPRVQNVPDEGIAALGAGAKNPVSCLMMKPIISRRRWTFPVMLRLPKDAPEFESFQTWTSKNEMYLQNVKTGEKLYSNSQLSGSASTSVVKISYNFTDPARGVNPADWTLHYRLPVNVVEMPIKVQINNVSAAPTQK